MNGKKQKKLITEELTWEQLVICGNQSYESGRTDEALLEYDKALILNPNNSLIYHNRGILYYNMEKNEEALLDYNKAIELNSQDSKIYNNRGNLYSDLGRSDDALNDFNQAIKLDPNFSDAYNSRAMLYVDLGKNDQALIDFGQAIKLKAQSNILKNRGILLFNLNQFDEALKDFNEAINLTQNDSTLYLNAAIILQAQNKNQEALEHYNLSIKLNTNDQRAYKSRAMLYSNLGEVQLAVSDLSKAILLKSDDFNAYYHRGKLIIYWKQKQLNLALQDFNQSIRLNPKYQNAYDCRGCLFLELGENNKAESDFSKSIELNTRSSNSYNNLGNFFVSIGNYQEALKNYQQAIQLDAYNSIYLINLGQLHLKLNDFQQAFIFFLQANSHLDVNKQVQLSSIREIIEKMLQILLEIFTEIEKENKLIITQPLEFQVKLDSINEIKQIEISVENQLKIILQPISLQSKQHQFSQQVEQLQEILVDTRIKFSLIHQSLKKEQLVDANQEQQLDTNQDQQLNQQQLPNINIATIQSGITNLKEQNNNQYFYFKSLCYNLISFMQFCFEIQKTNKILPQSSIEKQNLIPNPFCTFKEEECISNIDQKESLIETICEALGYQDNFKQTIINRNFAQLYYIENNYSENLEIEFHLLAIDLATKQEGVPEINSYFDLVEKISKIQMKNLQITSNIFWKKGILDSIKIIQFIDNNINRIISDGLQYLRMWKEDCANEEVVVIHQSLAEQLMAETPVNGQPTYCSFCSIS
ncbi:unnamed protein product (macronuclear) [Paramecium tetraurelia]|uniref:Uncharacterized protein n=1 Tax=Paramecium tetraurelia TaxID=5888 RepID=A0EEL8_PARTE|nr:uncharacterized protein GSPATT00026081001 [Paramecium tetraurelia]CAK93756.1 unnamed protein product [Paramecium tetraurelia]|eukprot:XP_001461132.1 hypothetical protein (macronuclear) [Paramecium tetraurelia strain d4-2]